MPDMSDIDRLIALRAIEQLKAERDRVLDRQDWDAYLALHAPDHCSYNGDYPPWTSAAEMVANVAHIMAPLTTAHHSHTPEIHFETPTTARGIWAMKGSSFWRQDGEDHWFIAFGHYFETYEKRDGRWRFTSRRLDYLHSIRSPGAIFPPPALATKPDRDGG